MIQQYEFWHNKHAHINLVYKVQSMLYLSWPNFLYF